MDCEKTTTRLIEEIYEAASDESLWGGVLTRLSGSFGASKSLLIRHDFSAGSGSRVYESSPDPHYAGLYATRFAADNPWLREQILYRPGHVFRSEAILPARDLVRTAFYQHYLRPQDCLHRLCGVLERAGPRAAFLSIHRAPGAQPFGDLEEGLLARLVPHVQRSLQLHRHVLHCRDKAEAMLDVLDRVPLAVFLVDRDGTPLVLNRLAEKLLRRNDGVGLALGRLRAAARADDDRVKRLIAEAAATTAGDGEDAGGYVAVSRPSGGHPLVLFVSPLARTLTRKIGERTGVAAIVAKDPDSRPATAAHQFGDAYHLTPAEVRLVALILGGCRLLEATRQLGISKNTARSHMKHIYGKTDTKSQADLIRLYASTISGWP